MAKILLIETATKTCSVGIADGKECIAIKEYTGTDYRHAELLHVFINNLIEESKMEWQELDAVCVSMGPGSYTGLRIGVSAAKGFCFGAETKLIGITTLQSLTNQAIASFPGYDYYIPMIDARRMEVFTQVFDSNSNSMNEIEALIVDESAYLEFISKGKCLFFGDGSAKTKDYLAHQNAYFQEVVPSASGLIPTCTAKYQNQEFDDVAYFEPFYLKDFIAGKKTQK